MEIKKIQTKKIEPGIFQRTEGESEEEIGGLADSIRDDGLLQPIGVVELKKDSYKLIFGERRLNAAIHAGEKEIEAKVYEDLDEVEMMEKCIIENEQRKDISSNEKDRRMFDTWKAGVKSKRYILIKDMAKRIKKRESYLRQIISAFEEKEKPENINNLIFQKATTADLDRTKSISGKPELRKKLLELEQEQKISALNLKPISDTLKIVSGVNDGIISDAIDISAKNKKIEPEKFSDLIETIAKSPEDIQEKIISENITVDEAKIINQYDFETKEEREIIIKERQKFEELNKKSVEKHTEVRKRQSELIKEGKNPYQMGVKTQPDMDIERKLDRSPDRFDNAYIEQYAKLDTEISKVLAIFNVWKMKTDEGQNIVKEYIKKNIKKFNDVLLSDPKKKPITIDTTEVVSEV